jgi:hypothetical protein
MDRQAEKKRDSINMFVTHILIIGGLIVTLVTRL